jgi:hypothetical protein
MNVQEHNQLIKVVFGNNKHFKHVLTNDHIAMMTLYESRYPISRLPVCGHCEKLGLWKGSEGYCQSCGTYTKNPLSYSAYLASGYDLDNSCNTSRMMMEFEQNKRSVLPDYGE